MHARRERERGREGGREREGEGGGGGGERERERERERALGCMYLITLSAAQNVIMPLSEPPAITPQPLTPS